MRLKLSLLTTALAVSFYFQAQAEDLLDIYKEAYLRDPVVLQAKADRDAAMAAVDKSRASLLPQIDVVGSISKSHTNVNPAYGVNRDNTASSAQLTLSQAIWRHSSWVNLSIAEKTATAKDLAYNDALQNLIIRVSNAYFNVLSAADTLTYQQANNRAVKRQLDEAVRQFQVGLIAETDRLEAQAAYDLSNAAVISAKNDLINSYEAIRLLIGRSITVDQLAKLDAGRFSTSSIASALSAIIKRAEANNYLLQQAMVNKDIAKDSISLAMTGHEPTLDLNASVGTGYTDYKHEQAGTSQISGNAWENNIGLSLNIPIYHGGATSADVKQAQAQYVSASEQLEYEHRNLVANVNNSYNNVNAAISSVKAYAQSVESAKSALDANQAGYEVGTRTMTDVLNATQNLYNALQKSAESRYNYIECRMGLLYNEGDLKVEHLEQVNNGLKR